jgi:hypothetical protein
MLPKSLLTILLLFALPFGLSAQQQTGIFQIPFEFVAFDSVFEPGEYVVLTAIPNHLRMLNLTTGMSAFIFSSPGVRTKIDGRDVLSFDRIGNLYLLRTLQIGGRDRNLDLPLSKKRREHVQVLITEGARPERMLIAASW